MPDLNHLLNRLTHLGDLDDSCSLDEQQEIEYGALVWDCTPQLAKALRAVLEVHQKTEHQRAYGFPRADKWEHYCIEDDQTWPCATVQAIVVAMEG